MYTNDRNVHWNFSPEKTNKQRITFHFVKAIPQREHIELLTKCMENDNVKFLLFSCMHAKQMPTELNPFFVPIFIIRPSVYTLTIGRSICGISDQMYRHFRFLYTPFHSSTVSERRRSERKKKHVQFYTFPCN